MQRLARMPNSRDPADGRGPPRRCATTPTLTGGDQPIGSVRDLVAADRPARLYVPTGAPATGPLLVFFHGGGFMHGDLESARRGLPVPRRAVRRAGAGGRLPARPRAPVPGGVRRRGGGVRAGRSSTPTSSGTTRDRIGVGGDSAGGNLAAGVALEAARRGWPCRVQLLDLPGHRRPAARRGSAELFATGFYLTSAYMELADASYARQRRGPRRPAAVAGPRRRARTGLAPALVYTAGFDPLRDEGEAYADHLADAGVAGRADPVPGPDPRLLQHRRRRPHLDRGERRHGRGTRRMSIDGR